MILFALPASPTAASFFSIICIGNRIPIANDATTNASQPNVAVFQWRTLQPPIRAAMFLDCFRGDMTSSFQACECRLRDALSASTEPKLREDAYANGWIEGRKRVGACDIELELFVELRVGHGDLHAVGRLAPEETDFDAVALTQCELSPVAAG